MVYKSNRTFRFWIASVGHSLGVIRSEMQYPDVDYPFAYSEYPQENIDLVFAGIEHFNIPTTLDGIEIRIIHEPPDGGLYPKGSKKYEIKSQGDTYFVLAYLLEIGVSNRDEDPISDPSLKYSKTIFKG